MLSKLLIKTFIRNNENLDDENIRNKYGYLAGIVGIISNFLLFVVKLSVGPVSYTHLTLPTTILV